MIREIRFFLAAVLLVLLQVWVFNYIFLFKVATPFVYIYTLMLLPLNVSVSALLWRAFIIGMFLDILSGVPGLHAASLTATAFVRNGLARPFLEKDSDLGYPPSARNHSGLVEPVECAVYAASYRSKHPADLSAIAYYELAFRQETQNARK